jgi:hypothetical protein
VLDVGAAVVVEQPRETVVDLIASVDALAGGQDI